MGSEKGEQRSISFSRAKHALKIYSYILPYKWHFLVGFISLVLTSSMFSVIPGGFRKLIDAAMPVAQKMGEIKNITFSTRTDSEKVTAIQQLLSGATTNLATDQLFAIGKWMALFLIIVAVLSFLRIYLFEYVSQRAMAAIRKDLFNKIIHLPYSFFEENKVGNLTSRITADVAQLQDGLTNQLAFTIRQLVLPIVCIPLLVAVSKKLTLIMLLPLPILIVVGFLFAKFIQRKAKQNQAALADTNALAEETFHNIDVVKTFTNEEYENSKFKIANDLLVKIGMDAAKYRSLFVAFVIFMLFGSITVLIFLGLKEVATNQIQIGQLIEFFLLSMFIATSLGGLSESAGLLLKTIGASERILEILGEKNEFPINEKADEINSGSVIFNHVSFRYPSRPDVRIFSDLNFAVKNGEKIALVGPSGSGKSSVIKLICGLYTPDSGEIIVDNILLESHSLQSIRSSIGIVPQEVMLFNGTIGENIAYGKNNATTDEIITAAKQANAYDFIQQFPEKMETMVGERGIKLSGGQKQRIAIARAILRNPKILILDEATSALDSESELLVKEALDKLMTNRTTFMIAHRLSTIRKADRIFVINKGKIEESGSHNELIQLPNGIYKNLLKIQYELE